MSININFDTILSFLLSQEIQQKLYWVKFGFLSIGALLLIAIIILISKTHYYQWLFGQDAWEFFTFRQFGAKRITKIWQKVISRLNIGEESELKMAIIEADDLLGVSLKRLDFPGKTFDDRLNSLTSGILSNIDDVHAAHNLCKKIIENPDYKINKDEVKLAIEAYKLAFISLQVLSV